MSTTTTEIEALERQLKQARELHQEELKRTAKLAGYLHPEAQPLELLKLTEVKATPMATTCEAPGVAVYLRISDDREGAGLGVQRQLSDVQPLVDAIVAAHPGVVVHLYVDNSLSASGKRKRPAYLQMLADMQAGKVGWLLAWHTDRLHRNLAELEDFMDAAERVTIQTAKGGLLDLGTPTGKLLARLLGAVARYEIDHAAERQMSKQLELARDGKPSGSPRVFGYTQGFRVDPQTGTCFVEAEALALQKVVSQVLAGASLRSQVAWLASQGFKGTRGSAITQTALRALLLRPAITGVRVYRAGKEDAQRFPALWPGIITEEQQQRLVLLLEAPSRKRGAGHNARKHLLTGLAACSTCGGRIAAATDKKPAKDGPKRYAIYRCISGHCVTRRADRVDAIVLAIVGARLARSDASSLLVDPKTDVLLKALAAQAQSFQAELARYQADYKAGLLTGAEYKPMRDEAQAKLTSVEVERHAHLAPGHVLEGLAGAEDAQALLEALPLSRQRAVIKTLGVPVIHKGHWKLADHQVVSFDWHRS